MKVKFLIWHTLALLPTNLPGSTSEVNIPGTMKVAIAQEFKEDRVTVEVFDKAQREIYMLMSKDAFRRFTKSKSYTSLASSVTATTTERHMR